MLDIAAICLTVVALTYGVVVFSILVQGLSIGHVTRKAIARPGE